MPVSWDYFVRRNSIDVASFLKKHDCNSYEGLCKLLDERDIILPERSEMTEYFPPPPPPPRKAPSSRRERLGIKKPTPKPKPSSAKRAAAKRTQLKKEAAKEVKDDSKQAG
tara:strand:+ start:1452 stop:1784 length:333 start_codon:yes stop_codon:yes gene_type:complete